MSQAAEVMLSSNSTDAMAMRQQVATWQVEISKLPLQAVPPIKKEPADEDAGKAAAASVAAKAAAAGPPAKKPRRPAARTGAGLSTDDEQPYRSAGSAADVEVLSSGDETDRGGPRAAKDESEGGRERSRSPH
jgi:hypothetical protein